MNRLVFYGFTLVLGIVLVAPAFGQSANALIRKGNQLYEQQQFPDAEIEYKKALSRNDSSATGLFNLGNTLYQQKQYDEASEQYSASAKNVRDTGFASQAIYNNGNTFMSKKDWKSSIPSFEQALKLNPYDNDARYNLAYAQEMLKKQQSGGGSKNNPKQNKQNQKQNQKQQNNPKQNQDQNQDQQNQPQQSKLTKQQADQLLAAAAQQEQKIQDKLEKNKKGEPVSTGKDW